MASSAAAISRSVASTSYDSPIATKSSRAWSSVARPSATFPVSTSSRPSSRAAVAAEVGVAEPAGVPADLQQVGLRRRVVPLAGQDLGLVVLRGEDAELVADRLVAGGRAGVHVERVGPPPVEERLAGEVVEHVRLLRPVAQRLVELQCEPPVRAVGRVRRPRRHLLQDRVDLRQRGGVTGRVRVLLGGPGPSGGLAVAALPEPRPRVERLEPAARGQRGPRVDGAAVRGAVQRAQARGSARAGTAGCGPGAARPSPPAAAGARSPRVRTAGVRARPGRSGARRRCRRPASARRPATPCARDTTAPSSSGSRRALSTARL